MRTRSGIVVICLLGLAGAASGQGQIAYKVDPFFDQYDYSTAPSIGVNSLAAVVLGTHRMVLFNKSGTEVDSIVWDEHLPDSDYPFAPAYDGSIRSLVHPRAEYDPISGRLWMMYAENLNLDPESEWYCVQNLHLAVSKSPTEYTTPGVLDSLEETHWWYYTGRNELGGEMTGGNGGVAFNLNDSNIQPFRDNILDLHAPTEDTVRLPSYGFDERAFIVAFSSFGQCAEEDPGPFQQFIYIIPRFNPGNDEPWLIDGDRADEDDMISIRMRHEPLILDDSVEAYVVQEPYEQYNNATLLISSLGATEGSPQNFLRFKGLFYNDEGTPQDPTDDEWEVRQSLEFDSGSGEWELFDTDIDDTSLNYFRPTNMDYPPAPGFTPTVEGDYFTSAVLTKDASGNARVFAVHAVLPDDGTGEPDDHWVVQWYVIDPDLADFHSAAIESDDWRPEVLEAGRIEDTSGHCYHPVLGVSTGGLMTIEYTYSSSTDEQEIRRARFNSSYAITSTTTLETGPGEGYTYGDRWALYGDLQFDPNPATGSGACNWLWSTHTLVDEDATDDTDIRDVWLFRKASTPFCFQTDMNSNGFTEMDDMVMYNNLFLQEDARADTDADGVVDATDMANYLDAYDKATGP